MYEEDNTKYDAKEERWYQVKIWVNLLVIFGLLVTLVSIVFVREWLVVHNGNQVTVPYTGPHSSVRFQVDDQIYYVDVMGLPVESDGDEITLYYYDGKESKAKAKTKPLFWLVVYGVFGSIFIASIRGCYVHYRVFDYSKAPDEK